ncbi:hypothetical protein LPJ78_001353 [Coemansia sp. RSA 989]|nr:hypothetical protein LPJ79_000031 [Coemansia sp. RSA 1821]KAJ1867036.1 hypothetical protein LPJ78_001353 [Coemansia sp. RSA 989]KAJ2676985.1 hypothetical protein IWW42_000323 [Coemansia sp. RSA 1085]
MDPVSALPSNVTIDIFRKLPLDELARCMLVSKLWYYSIDRWNILWRCIDKTTWSNMPTSLLNVRSLEHELDVDILGDNRYLDKPEKRFLRFLQDSELWNMVRRAGPALKKLVLEFELQITEAGFHSLLHFGCVNLRHLDIHANGNLRASMIGEIIARAGPCLETVALVAVGIDNSNVRDILLNAPNLKHLDLSYCMDLTFDAFPSFLSENTSHGDDIAWDSRYLALLMHPSNPHGTVVLPKLACLRLMHCIKIDNMAVSRIIETFSGSLRTLDVQKTAVTIQGLYSVLRAARQCGYKAVERPGSGMAEASLSPTLALQSLNIQYSDFVSNANVLGANMSRDPELSPWTVADFAKMAPKLTSIYLGGRNSYINDEFIEQLAQGLPGLLQVSICESERLSDRSLLSLASNCPKLQVADISRCLRFSDAGVIALVQACGGLKYLNLSVLAITDDTLAVIGDSLRNLKSILLKHCMRVTFDGIVALVEGSNGLGCQFTLQHLSLADSSNASEVREWCQRRLSSDAIIC